MSSGHLRREGAAPLPYRPGAQRTTEGYLRDFTRLHDDVQPISGGRLAIAGPGSPPSPLSSGGMQQIAAPPPIQGPGPVVCDDSSGDDDELGIVKVKFGAEDQGPLGIEFKEVSIKSCNPSGMGQFRAGRPLEAGMVLRAINGVPADRLAFNAVLELVGHHGGDIRGLTLTFQKPDHMNMGSFNPDSPEVRGNQQELIDEMSAQIMTLRETIDEKDAEIESLKHERDEQETTVIEALAPLLPRGRAKHDYPANPDDFQEGDLRFSTGNKIVLLDLSDEEWARGYVENKPESVGDFPRAYIEIVGNVSGVGSADEAVNEEMETLRAEVEKLRAIVDTGNVDEGMQHALDKQTKQIVKLKKSLSAASKGDVAEAMTDAEEAARKDKKMVAKLKKRVLKDQKVLKRQHEEMEILIETMRDWKRELQMILSDFAHMEAMFSRMQDEFDSTIPRAAEMIVDKIIECGVGGGGGINEEEVDALVAERVDEIVAEKDAEIEDWIAKHNKECVERRRWFNVVQEMKGNIRVFCRCRPLIGIELDKGEQIVCKFDVEGEIVVGNAPRAADNKLYEFDQVFGPDCGQEDIFEDTRQLVQSAMDGYNVCIFAYGQTGSGKTFTMEGDLETNPGINLRALQELFRLRDERDGHYTVILSQVEVYCEMVRDLLAPASRAGQSMELKSVGDGACVLSAAAAAALAELLSMLTTENAPELHWPGVETYQI